MNTRTPYRQAHKFFYLHAAYSYDPSTQTQRQGRVACARSLALAELQAKDAGYRFEWELDHIDSSYFSDEQPFYSLWSCIARNASGTVVASLGGIDFGRDKEPWGDPYKRVVEAELAQEGMECESNWRAAKDLRQVLTGCLCTVQS